MIQVDLWRRAVFGRGGEIEKGKGANLASPINRGDSGSFDGLGAPELKLLSDCVHCGFCMPSCPTYQLWGEEMDSPRGRIDLMRHALDGSIPLDRTFAAHMDACLGCMACLTACPSGVHYDELIEATRAQIERNVPRPLSERAFRGLIFWLFPNTKRLKKASYLGYLYNRLGVAKAMSALGIMKALPSSLVSMQSLMPRQKLTDILRARKGLSPLYPSGDSPRLVVGLQTGCIAPVYFNDVHEATIRVLVAEGVQVVVPPSQGCCGALSQHSGRGDAVEYAKAMITLWDDSGVDLIVTNAAGCGSMLKEYGRLFVDDPHWKNRAQALSHKVRDIMELLAELPPVARREALPYRVAYHDACHLAHAQKIRSEPRQVLEGIPDLDLVEVPDGGTCCGSAGIYNLIRSDAASELGQIKARNVNAVHPQVVAAGNPGCLLQIGLYLDPAIVLVHPIMLVDASIRGDTSALRVNRRRDTKGKSEIGTLKSKAPLASRK